MAARRVTAVVAAVAMAGALTSCGTGPEMTATTPPASSRPPFFTTPPSGISTGRAAAVSSTRWQAIVDDLSGRDVDGAPEIVSSEAVTWPNGALGCPAPGMSYTQQVVDGLRVVVRAGGRSWDYRFGTGDTPRLCEGAPTSSR